MSTRRIKRRTRPKALAATQHPEKSFRPPRGKSEALSRDYRARLPKALHSKLDVLMSVTLKRDRLAWERYWSTLAIERVITDSGWDVEAA